MGRIVLACKWRGKKNGNVPRLRSLPDSHRQAGWECETLRRFQIWDHWPDRLRLSFSRRDVALIVSTCCARAVERRSGGDWLVEGARAALDVRDADGRWCWRHNCSNQSLIILFNNNCMYYVKRLSKKTLIIA